MQILIIIISLLLFIPKTFALVDLKSANFSDAWVDYVHPGTGFDLRIERAYNSRTLFSGMFGFGWCSEFETSLETTPEGNLKLQECGTGSMTLYISKGFSEKDVASTVKSIVARYKTDNAAVGSANIAEFEKRLMVDPALRADYATKYGITRTVAEKTRFLANGVGPDYIEKIGSNYVRTLTDSVQKFKLNGKLEKIYDRNQNYLTLNYENNQLKDVTDNAGRKVVFSYYENSKVKTITGPNSAKVEYKYKNLVDLVWVKAVSGNIYQYEYDELHNMTKAIFPNKTFKEMTYNKDRDWITSYRDVEGCLESYDYKQSTDNPKDHFWATVEKKCKSKVILKARYEFWYELKTDYTGKYLKKSKTQENDQLTDVTYNESGKPLLVTFNGKATTKYEYYPDGLLKKKTGPDGIATLFKYDNAFKKVSRVEKGTKTSDFTYDTHGNLIKALNSDGQKILLTYDPRGRIQSIEDQAKRRVTIKYEERFGKPSVIERDGVGSLNVTYNTKGDIQKVNSAGGPSVAIQVASTFNNLLDLLQPAGVGLSF